MFESKTEQKRRQRIKRLQERVKKLDTEIRVIEYREKAQAKKDRESLRYLLGRTVDYGLILGELELGILEPPIDKHIEKPGDRSFLWQFFPSRTATPTPLKTRPLSPAETVMVGGAVQQIYNKAERKGINRRLYHWGVMAEAEAWQNEAWFRALLERSILYESDRRFLGLESS